MIHRLTRLLILTLLASLILAGCTTGHALSAQPKEHDQSMCKQIRQEIILNENADMDHTDGNLPLERARLYQLYKKYNCEKQESSTQKQHSAPAK